MTKLFGTDGIRGEAGVFPLDAATVKTVGNSLATHLRKQLGRVPLVIVGRDTRESGEWIEEAIISGVRNAGGVVKSAGVMTTPGVAFLTRSIPGDAGVVISASHNPYQDNGLKVFGPSGRKIDDNTERLIEADVFETPALTLKDPIQPSPNHTDQSPAFLSNKYLDFLADEIGTKLSLRDLRIVIDCANGASSTLAPQLFKRLGASVTTINDTPDGRNINLGCGSLHMEGLQARVIQQQADLGIAFDGDADRSLFVDATGQLVNGDGILWVLGKYFKSKGQLHLNNVVATVMSNIGLEVAFRSEGINLTRTDVGDKYVLEELLRSGACLGGEQSGHIIFPKVSLAGDGMITALFLFRAMLEENNGLHQLMAGFQNFPQILLNVKVKIKKPFDEVKEIQTAASKIEKALGSHGRLLLRYSGTEPLARVMLEGESQNEIEKHANDLAEVIRNTIGN